MAHDGQREKFLGRVVYSGGERLTVKIDENDEKGKQTGAKRYEDLVFRRTGKEGHEENKNYASKKTKQRIRGGRKKQKERMENLSQEMDTKLSKHKEYYFDNDQIFDQCKKKV